MEKAQLSTSPIVRTDTEEQKKNPISTKMRSNLEIIATILRATSQNGGMMITNLRERANLSWTSLTKYVGSMLAEGLLYEEMMDDGNLHFARVYKPTEKGYGFLLAYNELISTLNLDEKESLAPWS